MVNVSGVPENREKCFVPHAHLSICDSPSRDSCSQHYWRSTVFFSSDWGETQAGEEGEQRWMKKGGGPLWVPSPVSPALRSLYRDYRRHLRLPLHSPVNWGECVGQPWMMWGEGRRQRVRSSRSRIRFAELQGVEEASYCGLVPRPCRGMKRSVCGE